MGSQSSLKWSRLRQRAARLSHHRAAPAAALVLLAVAIGLLLSFFQQFPIEGTTLGQMLPIIRANINRETRVMTDELPAYKKLGDEFSSHDYVNHSAKEYVRGDVTTNTVEGYYSIFKRGMKGIYQHCAEKHLHRYLRIPTIAGSDSD